MTQRIVINACYGGFGLSKKAIMRYGALSNFVITSVGDYSYKKADGSSFSINDIPRNDLNLIKVIEDLGEESWGSHAELKIVEIPDGIDWQVDEYDGLEWVAEAHRRWS